MKQICAALMLGLLALPAAAQVSQTERAQGATLRTLDKLSGRVADQRMLNGDQMELGRLTIRLGECRFPPGNIQGEAFAWIDVLQEGTSLFSGWMIASSPALSALDDPRYDVWVLRCNNS